MIKSTYNESRWNSHSKAGDNNSLIDIETVINIDLHFCIITANCKSLMIDSNAKECPLDLIGYILTEENLSENANLCQSVVIQPVQTRIIISEVANLIGKITEYEDAQYNKNFHILISRVQVAEVAINRLLIRKEENL